MDMKRFTRPFRQLRGKLTLSYTLTSVVTFLLIEVIAITALFLFISSNISNFVLSDLKQEAPQAAPYFVHGSPDREALTNWLQVVNSTVLNQGLFNFSRPVFFTVVDPQGQTIASIGTHPVPSNSPIQEQLAPQDRANLQTVLHDLKGATGTVSQGTDGTLVAIGEAVLPHLYHPVVVL